MAAAASSSSSNYVVAVAVVVLAALAGGAWCRGPPVTFTVKEGSGPNRLIMAIGYGRVGDRMAEVEMRLKGSNEWMPLKEVGGGVWQLDSAKPLAPPFSFRFASKAGIRNVFDGAIPADYKVGTIYTPEE